MKKSGNHVTLNTKNLQSFKDTVKPVYKNHEFQSGEGSCLKEIKLNKNTYEIRIEHSS